MDNEVIIVVRSENETKPGFAAARADAHMTAADIEGTFKASGKKAGKNLAEGITAGTNDSGSGVGEKIAKGVEEKLRDSKGRFRKSGEEIGEGLGAGTGVKFGKRFVDTVGGSFPQLGKRITSEFSAIAAQSTPILATIGVAAAPLIGATLSAAIIGGAGVGGVIGGVMLAARDQRVAHAGIELGNTINSQLTRDATPFIQPTLNAISQLGKAFDANDSHIQNIFKNSARYVEPLTRGITGLISGLMRGLDSLTSSAGPVIGALGKGLTEVGSSLGDMFTQISGQSEGAAAALGDLFGAISGIIQVLGPLIVGLTAVYGVLSKFGIVKQFALGLLGPLGQIAAMLPETGDAARKTGSGTFGLAKSMDAVTTSSTDLYSNLQSTTASMDDMAKAARGLTDQNNSLYSSTTDVASALAEASKKIKDNGRDLRLSTKAGRENRDALSQVASKLQANYDAYVKVNGVGPKSAKIADDLRGKFITLAQKAGLSAGAARNLANQLLAIPSSRNTKITAQNAQALEAAREVRRAISSVQSKTVTLTIARRVTGSSASASALQSALNKQNAHGGITGAAAAPISSGFTWVGEHGPELIKLPAGTQVKSNPDSMRSIPESPNQKPSTPAPPPLYKGPGWRTFKGGPGTGQDMSGGPDHRIKPGSGGGYSDGYGSGSVGPIYITLEMDGRTLTTAMVDPMRDYVRTAFGGSVQKAYGKGPA